MTRNSLQNQQNLSEVCDDDSEASALVCCLEDPDLKRAGTSKSNNSTTKRIGPQFSEVLWEGTLKRHCDSRQTVRNLLDRYIKPHH